MGPMTNFTPDQRKRQFEEGAMHALATASAGLDKMQCGCILLCEGRARGGLQEQSLVSDRGGGMP